MSQPLLIPAPFELSAIKAIELAAAKIPGSISLAQGIPSFATPEPIREFVCQKIQSGACDKYSLTNGLPVLREEIALSLSEEKLYYDPETEIIATAGSIEGITASLLAVTQPGEEVILPSPTYASYSGAIRLAKCTPKHVALNEEKNFDFDISLIEQAISRKTRAILYCNPNNPTGTIYSEENTRKIMQLAEKHNLFVIVDEVYKDFYYSDHQHFSPACISATRPRLIRVCSFSKAFAMTGWRIGFVLGDAAVMREILKYHDAMVTCAPVVSQYAAIAALRFGKDYLEQFRSEYRKRRDYAIARLDDLSQFVDYQIPCATYFVFPRIKDTVPLARDSRALAYDLLEKYGLATVPGAAFGPSGESHLRINFGREFEDLEEGFDRISKYLNQQNRQEVSSSISQRQNQSSPQEQQSQESLTQKILSACARMYLNRSKVRIIGIAGLAGKTVFKRQIAQKLGESKSVRSSILSYNTALGLPLSILGLKSPQNLSEKLLFPLKLLKNTFLQRDRLDYLVLEYGISSEKTARKLLSIARPDWLIISRVQTGDPSLNQREFLSGLKVLIDATDEHKIFFPEAEPCLEQLGLNSAIKVSPVGGSSEIVGLSARLASSASRILAEKLAL